MKLVSVSDVCKEVFAGGDVPKNNWFKSPTKTHNVPIYSNGEANAGLYGYTNYYRVGEPSVTVSARGTIGYTAVRSEPFVPVVRLITLIPRTEMIDLKYLCYAIQNYKFEAAGTSIPQLTVPMLKKYSFKLVGLEEQKRIVKMIDGIVELVEKRKQQLQKLDELVKARFVELFGDVKTNDKKWSDGILSEYFFVKGGKRIPKGMGYSNHVTTHPYLRTTDMKNSTIIDDDIHYIDEEVFQKIKRYIVNAGDIYLTNVGVNLGMAGTIPERYDGANLTENAVKLIPKSNNFNGDFLAFYINSSGIQDYITERKMTVGVPKLAIFRIETMPLVIPPIEIQNKFADFVQQIKIESTKQFKQTGSFEEVLDAGIFRVKKEFYQNKGGLRILKERFL